MKERPIIFSGPMVRAILTGRKTQTRRVVAWNRKHDEDDGCVLLEVNQHGEKTPGRFWPWAYHDGNEDPIACPYGIPGDRLWVRETWYTPTSPWPDPDHPEEEHPPVSYSDEELYPGHWKKRPSIFMPRWASRILLEVIEVRVERLQEITGVDAQREGVRWPIGNAAYRAHKARRTSPQEQDAHRVGLFIGEWNKLNAKLGYGWETNPWVWVVEFRVLEAPNGRP